MNRAEKRLQQKLNKENKKILNRKVEACYKQYTSPAAYVNNKPVYIGSAVFLKSEDKIKGRYDWNLNKLIDKNHRFVILHQKGITQGILLIGLLSTSSYLNEENKLGIKLSQKYNTNKYIYMDAKNCWVIDSSCIDREDYRLSESDITCCVSVIELGRLFNINLQKGLLDSPQVDESMNYFSKYLISTKDNSAKIEMIDNQYIKWYVESLSYESVQETLLEMREDYKNLYVLTFVEVKNKYSGSVTDNDKKFEQFARELLINLLIKLDRQNPEDTKIGKFLQVGY